METSADAADADAGMSMQPWKLSQIGEIAR
jgi:hypothetical protein